MMHPRFPLFFIICFACLGLPPHISRETLALTLSTTPVRAIAIAPVAQAPSIDGTTSLENSGYDRAMQAGYEATQKRDYQAALKHFREALKARPNDAYAQQAVRNIETYLTRDKNRSNNPFFNFPWMLLGLAAISAGIGAAFLFFLVGILRQSTKTSLPEEPYLPPQPENESQEPIVPPVSFPQTKSEPQPTPKANSKAEKPKVDELAQQETDKGLPIQPTTRIASVDLVDTLIEDLHQPDPRKRRKAIWELAQKADSRAMKPLVDLMIDADSQERGLILEALSQISTRTLKPMQQALAISLQDNNPQVRKNAIRDTTKIYDLMTQISQMLCHAMEDSDAEVQETAKWAFNQLNLQMPRKLELLSMGKNSSNSLGKSYTESSDR